MQIPLTCTADKAVIELIVETKDPEVINLLRSNGIDEDETIYITVKFMLQVEVFAV